MKDKIFVVAQGTFEANKVAEFLKENGWKEGEDLFLSKQNEFFLYSDVEENIKKVLEENDKKTKIENQEVQDRLPLMPNTKGGWIVNEFDFMYKDKKTPYKSNEKFTTMTGTYSEYSAVKNKEQKVKGPSGHAILVNEFEREKIIEPVEVSDSTKVYGVGFHFPLDLKNQKAIDIDMLRRVSLYVGVPLSPYLEYVSARLNENEFEANLVCNRHNLDIDQTKQKFENELKDFKAHNTVERISPALNDILNEVIKKAPITKTNITVLHLPDNKIANFPAFENLLKEKLYEQNQKNLLFVRNNFSFSLHTTRNNIDNLKSKIGLTDTRYDDKTGKNIFSIERDSEYFVYFCDALGLTEKELNTVKEQENNDILLRFKRRFPIPFYTNGITPYKTVKETV